MRWTERLGGSEISVIPSPINHVSMQDNDMLISLMSAKEVYKTFYAMAEDKAFGSDGFHFSLGGTG